MKKRIKEKKRVSKSGILTSAVFGACISSIIFITLLKIFSLIGLASNTPHALLTPFSFFSIYTATFFGGFVAVKKNKGRDALFCGLFCGCIIALLFSLVFGISGLIFNVTSEPISWLYRALIIISSIIGSLLGINKSTKRPKNKIRRYTKRR